MSDDDWSRPYWEPSGRDASVRLVIFGEVDFSEPISKARYRTRGLPDGFDLGTIDGEGIEWIHQWATGPSKSMTTDGMMLADAAAVSVGYTLHGVIADPRDLDYLRDIVGLAAFAADHGAVALYDIFAARWWRPDAWLADVFEPDPPSAAWHVGHFRSGEPDGSTWLHTRGMLKFGRPDLSIHHVGDRHLVAATELLERLIGGQVRGHVIAEGQEITMGALPPGGRCSTRGSIDDPEFNNVHVAVEWPKPGLR